MSKKKKYFPPSSRRHFFKTAGALGLGALLGAPALAAKPAVKTFSSAAAKALKVPTRTFGRSGRAVSILALGGMFDIAANQLMLKQAIKWGVTYWDTADCYQKGSETGIGRYFAKYPQDREKVFLVTKSDSRDPEGLQSLLDRSLARMSTSYVDLYLLHGIRSTKVLDDKVRRWAQRAKARNQIKLFGFSTHSNMAQCLQAAAGLDWIDGILLTYNIRNMNTPEMENAVNACVRAGIGLTAMKTQAGSSWFNWNKNDPSEARLMERLKEEGWTPEQAKLKAVWHNSAIASICSQMDSMKLLKANVQAAAEPGGLAGETLGLLRDYCRATADQYCAGCSRICEAAVAQGIPIGDLMRYHMYNQSYGRPDWAKAQVRRLPQHLRHAIAVADYSRAEGECPQGLPIGRLMRQAMADFV